MAQKLQIFLTVPGAPKHRTGGHDDEVNQAFRGPP